MDTLVIEWQAYWSSPASPTTVSISRSFESSLYLVAIHNAEGFHILAQVSSAPQLLSPARTMSRIRVLQKDDAVAFTEVLSLVPHSRSGGYKVSWTLLDNVCSLKIRPKSILLLV